MDFFSKKSIIAVAAMFLATAMFIGCGSDDNPPPNNGKDTTGGQGGGEGVDLASQDWVDEGAWEVYVDDGGYGKITNFEKNAGNIEWEANVIDQRDVPGIWGTWQNAGVAVYINEDGKGVFITNKTKMKLTYSSSNYLEMALDGTAPVIDGVAYIAILPNTDDQEITIQLDFSKCNSTSFWSEADHEGKIQPSYYTTSGNMHFKIPAYWENDYKDITGAPKEFALDHSKITAIQFNLAPEEEFAKEAFVNIKKLELIDADFVE
jgi:hypothetical protein